MGVTRQDIDQALDLENKNDEFRTVVFVYLDACDKAEMRAVEAYGYFFYDMLPACPRQEVWDWLVELDRRSPE